MDRDTVYFIISIVLVIGASSGVFFYQHQQITMLTQQTQQGFDQMATQITDVQSNLDEQAFVLDQKIDVTKESLSEVDTQFNQRLVDATKQIDAVRKQSAQGISQLSEQAKALESDILNINVQSQDFSVIIPKVIDGVVSIRTDTSVGSGAIVHRDGFIVTNAHVLQGATSAAVLTYDQKVHQVTVIATNTNLDLALIKIDPKNGDYHVFTFDKTAKVGQKVAAMGAPGGLDFTVTEGIISAINRQSGGLDLLQIDVPINPGNSGGPLVTIEGKIAGINTLKRAGFEGVGFAINADTVDDFVDSAIAQYEASLAQQN